MVLAELDGHSIEMTGRPLVSGGEVRRTMDGRIGLHVDEFPEQAALRRWQRRDFEAVERGVAKQWRQELGAQNLTRLVEQARGILPANRKVADMAQLKHFIDGFCEGSDRGMIPLLAEMLGLSAQRARELRRRWERGFKRPLDRFVPYTAHVFKADLLFYLGVARGFISADRPSNLVDFAYLYYLPFAAAFVSGDRLHARSAPLLMADDQVFMKTDELKAALQELDAHYDGLPPEVKQLGVLTFATYPPSDLDNAVTRLWDTRMRSDWRTIAARREVTIARPPDTQRGWQAVRELEVELRGAELMEDGKALGPEAPDYTLRQRFLPATKGRWRMVPDDVGVSDPAS